MTDFIACIIIFVAIAFSFLAGVYTEYDIFMDKIEKERIIYSGDDAYQCRKVTP